MASKGFILVRYGYWNNQLLWTGNWWSYSINEAKIFPTRELTEKVALEILEEINVACDIVVV